MSPTPTPITTPVSVANTSSTSPLNAELNTSQPNIYTNNQPIFNLDFEKFKYKIELFKWVIGSVVLVLIYTIINWGFQDRSVGMDEIREYEKYTTDLITLNNDPVRKRMLAQYFSSVTPSKKLRDGWENYYKEVNIDVRRQMKVDKRGENGKRQFSKLFHLNHLGYVQFSQKVPA